MKKIAISLMTVFLFGCASFDLQPEDVGTPFKIEDFPKLKEFTVYVDKNGIKEKCQPHVEDKSQIAAACASVNFLLNTCTIYIEKDAPYKIVLHEKLHCEGWDHKENGNLHKSYIIWRPVIEKIKESNRTKPL